VKEFFCQNPIEACHHYNVASSTGDTKLINACQTLSAARKEKQDQHQRQRAEFVTSLLLPLTSRHSRA
jgi:hypothetical protein